jgi:hypothetical protein
MQREYGRAVHQTPVQSKLSPPYGRDDTLTLQKQFPDYYETIKHPMCLDDVRQKLDKQEYETLKEVTADIGQIFINAKRCASALQSQSSPTSS